MAETTRTFRWGVLGVVLVVVVLIAGALTANSLFENLDAHDIMVIQSPFSGKLAVYTEPGVKWQGFGKVTKYPRRSQYDFSTRDVLPNGRLGPKDTSKRLRFNDGGHGNLYGAVSWEMPLDKADIVKIHKTFGSAEAVEQQAVAKMIDNAVYLAGPLMSSTESSGERRAELVQYINDQAEHGVYVTQSKTISTKDPITGSEKTVVQTEIVRDKLGHPERQQSSILAEFHINLLPLSINELKYDSIVEGQIKQRQKATTEVQIAIANARKAEQDALTATKQGEAEAAKAKWAQEVIKAKEVTQAEQKKQVAEIEAQQELDVATLKAKAAEQYKREQILRGEGEAARRQLVMQADGALKQKLDAYIEVNRNYANAIARYQGAWVPSVVMSGKGQGTGAGNGASDLISLLTAKTAKDLSMDLSLPATKLIQRKITTPSVDNEKTVTVPSDNIPKIDQ